MNVNKAVHNHPEFGRGMHDAKRAREFPYDEYNLEYELGRQFAIEYECYSKMDPKFSHCYTRFLYEHGTDMLLRRVRQDGAPLPTPEIIHQVMVNTFGTIPPAAPEYLDQSDIMTGKYFKLS